MPEDCVPCETLTTVPHMLYAWRLRTLLHSNNSPTHALCLKTAYPLTLKQQSHTCSMPEDCVPSYTQTTVPHMLYAWRLRTLWNSNDSPTHALCLKTLPSEAQTAVQYMLYASRPHIYPEQLKRQSHTCSMPQDFTLWSSDTQTCSPIYMLYVSQLHVYPANSNNSPTQALCLKTVYPLKLKCMLCYCLWTSVWHMLYSWRPHTPTLWKSLPFFKKRRTTRRVTKMEIRNKKFNVEEQKIKTQ